MGALRFRCRAGAGAIVAFVSALMNPSAYGQPSIAHVPAMGGGAAVSAGHRGDAIGQWRNIIAEASARFGVPSAWIEQVMRAESRGLTIWQGRPITSRAGAMGLMQLMPATWASMRSALGLGADPYQPRDNILAGTAYLRAMYDRFGYPGLFGAYNAGPGRYGASVNAGRSLPVETRDYLDKITRATEGTAKVATNSPEISRELPRETRMFVELSDHADQGANPGSSISATPQHDPMFVLRTGR